MSIRITTGSIVCGLKCSRLIYISHHKFKVELYISKLNALWKCNIAKC